MAYIASDKIKVFPSVRRVNNQQDARLLTEATMVGIINQLVDMDAFVITSDEDMGADNPFEFNIKGYYFKVNKLSDITNLFNTSQSTTISAGIILDTANDYVELQGQDDDSGGISQSVYKGVMFSDGTLPAEYTSFTILTRDSSSSTTWITPNVSRVRYDSTSMPITKIDGGIITITPSNN